MAPVNHLRPLVLLVDDRIESGEFGSVEGEQELLALTELTGTTEWALPSMAPGRRPRTLGLARQTTHPRNPESAP